VNAFINGQFSVDVYRSKIHTFAKRKCVHMLLKYRENSVLDFCSDMFSWQRLVVCFVIYL